MSAHDSAVEIAASETETVAPGTGASVVSIVTVLISIFNIVVEAAYDILEWTDLIEYRGLGWTMVGSFFLFVSIFTAVSRGKVALIVSIAIAIYYSTQIIPFALSR